MEKNGTRDCKICRKINDQNRYLQKRQSKPIAIRTKPKPNDADLNWAAGLFEGEGTITMSRIKSVKTDKLTVAKAMVGNTDLQVVQFFHNTWGGVLRTRKKIVGKRQAYEWVLTGNQVWIFASDILPHLRTDRVMEKTQLIIESEEFRKRSPRFGEEALVTQNKLWEYLEKFRVLNKRGDNIDLTPTVKKSVR